MKQCLQCGKELKKGQNKFCCSSCAAKYNNSRRGSIGKGFTKRVHCINCGKEIDVNIHSPKGSWICNDCSYTFECEFCKNKYKNPYVLSQHLRFCELNPNHEDLSNKPNRRVGHYRRFYENPIKFSNIFLDITQHQFEKYQEKQTTCEICGKTIDEAVAKQHKYMAKRFCLDHNHKTNQFRGLLCSCCNRQLGWYEKYRGQISKYLDKDLIEQNKNI